MITMDLREAIQLQSVYGPGTGAYRLVADLGQARDSVLAFLCAPLPPTSLADDALWSCPYPKVGDHRFCP